jgi:hypothetical protein
MTDVIYKSVDDVIGLYDRCYIQISRWCKRTLWHVIYKSVDDAIGLYDRCYI